MTFFLGLIAGVVLGGAGALSLLGPREDYDDDLDELDDREARPVAVQPKVVTRLTNRNRSIEL